MDDATFRASVVGAAEVPALFDASPWLTHFELWHRKNGTIATPEFNAIREDGTPENERVLWGVKLESVIIEEACRRWGYERLDTPHVLDNGRGLGGHPDQLVTDAGAKVVLEVKTADWLVRKGWGDEPPLNYLLQNMTYQGLAGCVRGDMIVLVGGNQLERFQYEFRPGLYAEIESRVEAFWQTVRAGKPPKPDYTRDGAAIVETIGTPTDEIVDLSRNNRATILAVEAQEAKAREKAAAAEFEAARAELFDIIGPASVAKLDGYRIGCGMTKGTPDREAKPGEIIKGRRGYRRFDLKEVA